MSVPVYRRVTGSANQINVTSVYRHTVCNCERASKAGGDSKSGDRPDLIHHAIDCGGGPRACIAGEGLQSAQGCHITGY